MPHDPIVMRRWSSLLPLLDSHSLEGHFVPAENESVDDAIEVRLIGSSAEEDLGDIQICFDGTYCGNSWTTSNRDARRMGGPRRNPLDALNDLIGFLKRDGMLPETAQCQ